MIMLWGGWSNVPTPSISRAKSIRRFIVVIAVGVIINIVGVSERRRAARTSFASAVEAGEEDVENESRPGSLSCP